MAAASTDVPAARPRPTIMPWVAAALTLFAICMVGLVAPPDREMGHVHRIFYFHVASAFAALIGWIGCAVVSLAYLFMAGRSGQSFLAASADRLAYALAEVGVLFGVVVLVTGPLWAKPEWGVYWNWEPRLVLMMLTQFLFIGYLVLRGYAKHDSAGKKLAAGIAVVGGPAVALIHVAVQLWGGNHPQVVSGDGQGIRTAEMNLAFMSAVGAILVLAGVLVAYRMRHHKLVDDLEDGFLELADREDAR